MSTPAKKPRAKAASRELPEAIIDLPDTDVIEESDEPAELAKVQVPAVREVTLARTEPTIGDVAERVAKAHEFMENVMKPAKFDGRYSERHDGDFGVVPGTGNKPVLLKPGAEKLALLFGLDVVEMERTLFERIEVQPDIELCPQPVPGYMVAYRCALAATDGRVLARTEAVASHDEATFHEYVWQGSGDSRKRTGFKGLAPLNTLMARAQKRAFVRAVVQATGVSDLFATGMAQSADSGLDEQQRELYVAIYRTVLPRRADMAKRNATKLTQSKWDAALGAAVDDAADVLGWNEHERELAYRKLLQPGASIVTLSEVLGQDVEPELEDDGDAAA